MIKDFEEVELRIYINPIYEKTNVIFQWIAKLHGIASNLDPAFDRDLHLNRIILEKGKVQDSLATYLNRQSAEVQH